MLLSTWIDKKGGTLKAGNILGVKRNVVYAWRTGAVCPRPALMKTIVAKTNGKVQYSDIINGYLALKAEAPKAKKTKPTKKAGAPKKKPTKEAVKPAKIKKAKTKKVANKPKGKKIDPGF